VPVTGCDVATSGAEVFPDAFSDAPVVFAEAGALLPDDCAKAEAKTDESSRSSPAEASGRDVRAKLDRVHGITRRWFFIESTTLRRPRPTRPNRAT
jgi:hypothetical protein